MLKTLLGIGVIGIVMTGCGTAQQSKGSTAHTIVTRDAASASATADCGGPGLTYAQSIGDVTKTTGSFATTAGAMTRWLSNRFRVTTTHFDREDAATPLSVCIYDGQFSPNLPVPPGATPPTGQRVVILVEGGQARLLQSGTLSEVQTTGPDPGVSPS